MAANSVKTQSLNKPWTSFTPSWTNITVGNGTNTGSYVQIGKTVHFRTYFKMGSTSSIGGSVTLALPVAIATYSQALAVIANVEMYEQGASLWVGTLYSNGGVRVLTVSGTRITVAAISSSVPFTWGTDDTLTIAGTYEAA